MLSSKTSRARIGSIFEGTSGNCQMSQAVSKATGYSPQPDDGALLLEENISMCYQKPRIQTGA